MKKVKKAKNKYKDYASLSREQLCERLYKTELELGHLHGKIGLFAKKHFGGVISDNLSTEETFKLMNKHLSEIWKMIDDL